MNLIQESALAAPPGPGRAGSPPRFVGTASATPLPGAATCRSPVWTAAAPAASPHA